MWWARNIALWAAVRLLRLIFRLRWRQRQSRRVIQDLPLLRRELVESPRLERALACVRRHGAQTLDRSSHSLLAVRRQATELGIHRAELLLLLRRQVLPGFHAVKNLLLLVPRQGVKTLQALLELLLAVRWQAAKCRVVLQRPALLI